MNGLKGINTKFNQINVSHEEFKKISDEVWLTLKDSNKEVFEVDE